MSLLNHPFALICVVIAVTSNLNVEARIKVLTILDDETVFIVREKPIIGNSDSPSKGMLIAAKPINACSPINPPPPFFNPVSSLQNSSSPSNRTGNVTVSSKGSNDDFVWILLVSWAAADQCSIRVKAENAAKAGYTAILFQDPSDFMDDSEPITPLLAPLTTSINNYNLHISEEGVYAATISPEDWSVLRRNFTNDEYYLSFEDSSAMNGWFTYFIVGILVIGAVFFTIGLSYVLVQLLVLILIWIRESIVSRIQQVRRDRRRRLPASQLKKIPIQQWNSDMLQDICSICLESYVVQDRVRILPCSHVFHQICIDPWLLKQRRKCPNCKRKIVFPDENRESDASSDDDERTPLLRRSSSARESSSASAGTSPRHSRSQQTEQQRRERSQSEPDSHSSQRVCEIHRYLTLGLAASAAPDPQNVGNEGHLRVDQGPASATSEPVANGTTSAPPNSHVIKEKVDQLCARMENVGRKIKRKAKQSQSVKMDNDSSSDMSTSAIQPVLVTVAVEPTQKYLYSNDEDDVNNDNKNDCDQPSSAHDSSGHDHGDFESHNECKMQQPSSSSSNANLNGSSSSTSCSSQNPHTIPVNNDGDFGLEVKVVPDCPTTSPNHNALNITNNSEQGEVANEDISIVPGLNA